MNTSTLNVDDARLWAAATLTEVPEEILFLRTPVEEVTRAGGLVWRDAFAVTLRLEEPARFRIHLREGASSDDLAAARKVIHRARQNGLTAADTETRQPLWKPVQNGWRYRALHAPRARERHDDVLQPCLIEPCVEQYHAWVGGEQFTACELEAIRGDGYLITGYLIGGEWTVGANVEADYEGEAGLQEIRALANDYAWMAGECARLNDKTETRNEA